MDYVNMSVGNIKVPINNDETQNPLRPAQVNITEAGKTVGPETISREEQKQIMDQASNPQNGEPNEKESTIVQSLSW